MTRLQIFHHFLSHFLLAMEKINLDLGLSVADRRLSCHHVELLALFESIEPERWRVLYLQPDLLIASLGLHLSLFLTARRCVGL
ncbi:unnamed protein product [Victoria cruziana]